MYICLDSYTSISIPNNRKTLSVLLQTVSNHSRLIVVDDPHLSQPPESPAIKTDN